MVVDKLGLLSVGYRIERVRLTNTGLYKTVLIIPYVNLTFAGVNGSGKHQILFLEVSNLERKLYDDRAGLC